MIKQSREYGNLLLSYQIFKHYCYSWDPKLSTMKNYNNMDPFGSVGLKVLIYLFRPWWMSKSRFIKFAYDHEADEEGLNKMIMLRYKYCPVKPSLREALLKTGKINENEL